MASLRRSHLPSSTAAPPLEDDDLLAEILLRLPLQPSSLPRASAVCTRWRGLLSDPAFRCRFRIHHRRSPPLVVLFYDFLGINIQPALDAPDRLPCGRFSLEVGDHFMMLGWRHGLALFFLWTRLQLLVWDPVSDELHRLGVPHEFNFNLAYPISGTVLRARVDDGLDRFQVVLVGSKGTQHQRRALASVYSSETGGWGDLISTPLPFSAVVSDVKPAVLAENCLHWLIVEAWRSTLVFDLDRQSLAVTRVPEDTFTITPGIISGSWSRVIRAEGGGMGFLALSDFTARLWKEADSSGVVSWLPGRTIELDKMFSLNSGKLGYLRMVGYAEENNVAFFWTTNGVFMVHLDSLLFKRISAAQTIYEFGFELHPCQLVYTPGIGGGHNGAKTVRRWWYTR